MAKAEWCQVCDQEAHAFMRFERMVAGAFNGLYGFLEWVVRA